MAKFESSYVLKDEQGRQEVDRLDQQHRFITTYTNGEFLHPSIPVDSLRNIADVATGTGIWLKQLSEQLESDKVPRKYTGFDLNLSLAPTAYPENFDFVQQNMLDPYPERYLGTFDLVHTRLLIAALKKSEIEPATKKLLTLLKPGGYLLWDDGDEKILRYRPQNDLFEKFAADTAQCGVILGFDKNITHTVAALCAQEGLQVETYLYESMKDEEMISKTKDLAREWALDAVRVMSLVFPLVLKIDKTKEEAKASAEELVQKLKGHYDEGLVPGNVLSRVVAKKP